MKITSLFLVCFTFLSFNLTAQQYQLESSHGYGPLLKIYPGFPNTTGVHNTSICFTSTNSIKKWRSLFNQPHVGVGITIADFGNNQQLGQGLGLQYVYESQKSMSNRLSFYKRLLMGIMYFNRPYHIIDNPNNIVVGSRFTFLMSAELGFSYGITEQLSTHLGTRFIHGSNSHVHLPNVGINAPTILGGIAYHWKGKQNEIIPTIEFDSINTHPFKFRGELGFGFNENGASTGSTNGPIYPIYMLGLGATKRSKRYGKVIGLLQVYYNSGYRTVISSQKISELENNSKNATVVIASAGYEFLLGRFGLNIIGGLTLHNPFLKYYYSTDEFEIGEKIKYLLPGKFGVNYYLFDPYKKHDWQLFCGVNVKSNFGQADFLETKIGVEF